MYVCSDLRRFECENEKLSTRNHQKVSFLNLKSLEQTIDELRESNSKKSEFLNNYQLFSKMALHKNPKNNVKKLSINGHTGPGSLIKAQSQPKHYYSMSSHTQDADSLTNQKELPKTIESNRINKIVETSSF